jgi:demethylmenaquinone methyltransferase / 2-methoxy-6-polyprenyl-1,4-benzoquinol methylase
MEKNKEKDWFGYKETSADAKTGQVFDVFKSVAGKYDIMNDLMSGGMHRLWKRKFVEMTFAKAGERTLDVAGGTGDIAFEIYRKTNGKANITISDINPNMLEVGKDRAVDRGYLDGMNWVEANAEKLPFDDNQFDLYTIAFGLRNVTHIDDALAEAHRVLKPGGRFFCMEFSHIENNLLGKIYDAYSFNLLPMMGKFVANDAESYQYLAESIRQFPKQDELKQRMEAAGFKHCRYTNIHNGLVAIHAGWKA